MNVMIIIKEVMLIRYPKLDYNAFTTSSHCWIASCGLTHPSIVYTVNVISINVQHVT